MSKINVSHVKNNSGGPAFELNPLNRLRRFMILGVTSGTYYQSEKALTYDNAKDIATFIANDGLSVVREIVEFSQQNRAPKKDPSLFALAMCAVVGEREVRKAAYDAMGEVCHIPTHLFTFIDYCEGCEEYFCGRY